MKKKFAVLLAAFVLGTTFSVVREPGAHAATGYSRCPDNYLCFFDGYIGTGTMWKLPGGTNGCIMLNATLRYEGVFSVNNTSGSDFYVYRDSAFTCNTPTRVKPATLYKETAGNMVEPWTTMVAVCRKATAKSNGCRLP
jgi:hypothetical protein